MRTDKYMMAKAWMKQDQAPQAEALETWNTLEAEFNEERKAMLMASAETDKIKEAMNKKFGSGTVKYGSELPQPEMKTPQAIFEFSQRNPAAEGGRMLNAVQMGEAMGNRTGFATPKGTGVQLTKEQLQLLKDNLTKEEFKKLKFGQPLKADALDIGVRQRGDKSLWRKVTNILTPGKASSGIKILNNKKLSDALIKSTNAGDDIETIITKMNKLDKKLSRNSISSAINALVARGQIDEEFGRVAGKNLTIGNQQAYNKIIEEAVDEGKLNRAQIARKADVSDSVVEDWIRENKGDDFYAKNFDYESGRLKTGNLQTRKDLFEFIENSDKITAKEISKNFKLDSKKTQTTLSDLVGDIYRMRTREGGSIIVPYDEPDRLKNVLDKIRDAPDFEDIYQRRIGDLVASAYPKGSKAQKQAMKSLSEYYKFSRALKEKFPELALSLDHVVPFQFLEEVKQGENPINLIKVKPTVSAVNRFKTNFDNARIELNRLNKIDPNNPDVKKRLKILNDLQKNIGIEFGGTSKGGYVYNFGAQPVGKSDLVGDAKKAIYDYQKAGKFSKKVLADEKLQKQLIEAGVDTGKDMAAFEKITPFSDKEFRQIIKVIGCPNFGKAGGGRIEFSEGKDCFDKGTKLINNGMKGASPGSMKNAAKFLNNAYKFGRNVMKFGIIPEAIFVGAESIIRAGGDQTLDEGFKSAIGFYLDPIFGTNFKSDARISQNLRNMTAKDTMDLEKLFKFNTATENLNKLKENQKNVLNVYDESLMGGVSKQDYKKQSDANIAKAQEELNKNFLTETQRVDFENKADTSEDIKGVRSPFRQAIGKARADTEMMRYENDFSGMQSDMFTQDPMSAKAKKERLSNLLPQKGMTPRLSNFVNFDDRQLEQLSGLTKKPVKELRDYQDYLNKERAMSLLQQEQIFGKEQTYGTQGNFFGEKINEKPMYDYAEGGITGLRSKYEYKK